MLSEADRRIVANDPDLPGLAVLLDGDHLEHWLSAGPVDRRYLRYKPGTSCLLGAVLTTPDGPVTLVVTAYAEQARGKLDKTVQRAPAGSVLAREDALLLLVTTSAADRDLPGARAVSRTALRLPHLAATDAAHLQLLSYKPQRRWVGRAVPTAGPPVVVRAYRRSDLDAAVAALSAFSAAGPRTPRVLGVDRRRALVATEWLAGRPLDQVMETGSAGPELGAAGADLAAVHTSQAAPLRLAPPGEAAQALTASVTHLGVLLPALRECLTPLADELLRRLPSGPLTPVHGDHSTDQVIVLDAGGTALLDLDRAHLGQPAADLGSAAAALAGRSPTWRDSFDLLLAGYAAVAPVPSPEALRLHTAAMLLRRAVEPFRSCTPDWEGSTEELVATARLLLDGDLS